jgi:hypothetical protein
MTQQSNDRVLFQMRLEPDLAKKLRARAAEETLPMCAWVRQQIVIGLDRPSQRARARQEAPKS